MRLSLQQKEQFFHDLRELIHHGQSLPAALELKSRARSLMVRKVAKKMLEDAESNANAEAYFAAVPTVFSELDRELIRGGQSAGRLDDATAYLSDYYHSLAKTRRRLIANTAYPIFLLHFGAVALAIPSLVGPGGMPAFGQSIVQFLAIFYVSLLGVWLMFGAAVRAAQINPTADRLLQSLPAIGGTRVALAGARFCMLMGILVKASGSILSAMTRSASASGSALFRQGAEQAVLAVQGGEGLGMAVMRTRAFPEAIDQAFQTGEVSGHLDEEMVRLAVRYNEQFHCRLEMLSTWLPKLVYIAIAVTLAYRVVSFYSAYYGLANSLLK